MTSGEIIGRSEDPVLSAIKHLLTGKASPLRVGRRVLVAVSGGIDSMVLLDALVQLQAKLALSLLVAHLDHQLRETSTADATFVEAQARARGVPYCAGKAPVDRIAKQEKDSLEAVARRVRREFLLEQAGHHRCRWIALGHTENDQAETLLLNLIRGTGLAGLGGMKPVSDPILRPLLCLPRSAVEAYAKRHAVAFRTDPSNANLAFRRNWVRHQLIPLLETQNPRVVHTLARNQSNLRQAHRYLVEQAHKSMEELVVVRSSKSVELNRAGFVRLPSILQAECLRMAWSYVKGDANGLSHDRVRAVIDGVAAEARWGQRMEMGQGWAVFIDRHSLTLCSAAVPVAAAQTLSPNGSVRWGGWTIAARRVAAVDVPPPRDVVQDAHGEGLRLSAYMDWGKINPPLVVRSRQPGDRIRPIGLNGSKKLQDIFVDAKVPRHRRDHVPVVADANEILWVAGHCQSEATQLDEQTTGVLHVRAERATQMDLP